jgi:hypothetical protein
MDIQTIVIVPFGPSQITLVRGPITITFNAGQVTIIVGDNFETDPVALSRIGSAMLRFTGALFADRALRDQVMVLAEAAASV